MEIILKMELEPFIMQENWWRT